MEIEKDFKVEESSDAKRVPKRIAFIKGRTSVRVKKSDRLPSGEEEQMVMTFPHLMVREVIAFGMMIIVLSIISLLFNAPLEWVANPEHTPNPAKAPWYFLGLQELLHYFPPVVGGVILPVLAVVALIVIPYFKINYKSEGLWKENRKQTFVVVVISVSLVSIILLLFDVYAMLIPTLLMTGLLFIPYLSKKETGWIAWFGNRSLAWWIMTWFVVIAVVLTAIGTLFRGPEWSWSMPWHEIY